MLGAYQLPEDDPLVSLVMGMDRELAKGRPGLISQVGPSSFLGLEPLPRRLLAAHERLARLGGSPIEGEPLHELVRAARMFEGFVGGHSFGGPLSADHDSPTSAITLKAAVPALLAIEATLERLDGTPPPADGVVEALAAEIRLNGHVWPYRDRHYRAVGELARRVLAFEARLDAIEDFSKKVGNAAS
jgi:hypothetical protein